MTVPGPLVPFSATARYVGDRFGLHAAEFTEAPVARGLSGRVWRLNTTDTRYVLKELFWDDEQEIRRWAVFEAAACDVGVRRPESLPTKDGDYLCRLPPELGGVYVRLYSWIEGSAVTSADGPVLLLGAPGRDHQQPGHAGVCRDRRRRARRTPEVGPHPDFAGNDDVAHPVDARRSRLPRHVIQPDEREKGMTMKYGKISGVDRAVSRVTLGTSGMRTALDVELDADALCVLTRDESLISTSR
jgi:hypothetical protein